MNPATREFEGSSPYSQLDELRERAQEYSAVARERLVEGDQWVRNYVSQQPVKAIGIAFGVGVLLGWLIKRR